MIRTADRVLDFEAKLVNPPSLHYGSCLSHLVGVLLEILLTSIEDLFFFCFFFLLKLYINLFFFFRFGHANNMKGVKKVSFG